MHHFMRVEMLPLIFTDRSLRAYRFQVSRRITGLIACQTNYYKHDSLSISSIRNTVSSNILINPLKNIYIIYMENKSSCSYENISLICTARTM